MCNSCGLHGEFTIQDNVPGDVIFSIGVMTHALVSRSLAKSSKSLCRVQGARITKRDDDVPGFKLEIGVTDEDDN